MKVRLEEVIVPAVRLSGAPGTVAARTDSVGPRGPSPWTLRALIANWYVVPATIAVVETALVVAASVVAARAQDAEEEPLPLSQ